MTPSQRSQEPDKGEETGITTRGDLKHDAPDSKPGEPVKLTAPSGTKVTVAEEVADHFRDHGYT